MDYRMGPPGAGAGAAAWGAARAEPAWPCVWRWLDCLNPKQAQPHFETRAPHLGVYRAPMVSPAPHRDDNSSLADSSNGGDSSAGQDRRLLQAGPPGLSAPHAPSSCDASSDAARLSPGARDAGPGPPGLAWGRISPAAGHRAAAGGGAGSSSTAGCGGPGGAKLSFGAAAAKAAAGGGGALTLAELAAGGVGAELLLAGREGGASDDDEDVCPTCLDPYSPGNPRVWTRCQHHYHLQCIYSWLERKDTCPMGCPGTLEFDIPT